MAGPTTSLDNAKLELDAECMVLQGRGLMLQKNTITAAPSVPEIFLSYASDDAWWVESFTAGVWFSLSKDYLVHNYNVRDLGYGPLRSALDKQIEGSSVVIAFVSQNYIQKEWTIAEWEQSLSQTQQRKLVFVPLMLDAHARQWWQSLRRDGRLSALSRDYQYVDFTYDGGFPRISANDNKTTGKIAFLCQRISRDLKAAEALVGVSLPPDDVPPRTGRDDGHAPDGPAQPLALEAGVVLLGHPTAALAAPLATQADKLARALEEQAMPYRRWGDDWRGEPEARSDLKGLSKPIFVQPLTRAEALDQAHATDTTGKFLEKAGQPDARVTLWLPRGFSAPDFEDAASLAPADAFPSLRTDTPEDLAKWLRGRIGPTQPVDSLVLQVEGVGSQKGAKAEVAAAAQRLADQLRQNVWAIVSDVVENPPPSRPVWPFWDTQFEQQVRILPSSRSIVAVHDLDIETNPDHNAVRKDLQRKFDRMHRLLEAAQAIRKQAGKAPLKPFWTALLVNNAEALPFGNYPDDGRYKDWRLLGFQSVGDAVPLGQVAPVRPDPASLAVFRTNLLAWANAA